MRIICPACETAYDVPDSALAPGRVLRCARCRAEWAPVAAAEVAEPGGEDVISEVPPVVAPPRPLEAESGRVALPVAATGSTGPRASVIAGWILSFLILGGLGYAAVRWRQPIQQIWPPSSRAYALLGYR
jgi:predicted Zn finger-like uncharacterized protein